MCISTEDVEVSSVMESLRTLDLPNIILHYKMNEDYAYGVKLPNGSLSMGMDHFFHF